MSLNPVRRPRRWIAAALITATAVFTSAAPARAAFVADSLAYIEGTGGSSGPGYFSGSVAVDNINTTTAVIRITLTNTSPAANGGFITGFAFNDPNSSTRGNISTVTSFTQSYNPAGSPPANEMMLIGGSSFTNTISGSPYGSFDIGAATGGSFLGGGTPLPGIEVDQTGTFEFTVTGTNLHRLTAARLMDTYSTGGSKSAPFLVRFRGFEDGSSDKVVGGITCDPPPPPPPPTGGEVPAPPAVLLGLIGVGGGLLGRVVRRRVTGTTPV